MKLGRSISTLMKRVRIQLVSDLRAEFKRSQFAKNPGSSRVAIYVQS